MATMLTFIGCRPRHLSEYTDYKGIDATAMTPACREVQSIRAGTRSASRPPRRGAQGTEMASARSPTTSGRHTLGNRVSARNRLGGRLEECVQTRANRGDGGDNDDGNERNHDCVLDRGHPTLTRETLV